MPDEFPYEATPKRDLDVKCIRCGRRFGEHLVAGHACKNGSGDTFTPGDAGKSWERS